ncbi:MAG: phosphoribosyltransferase family protein [Thermomicrobiales bacterium]
MAQRESIARVLIEESAIQVGARELARSCRCLRRECRAGDRRRCVARGGGLHVGPDPRDRRDADDRFHRRFQLRGEHEVERGRAHPEGYQRVDRGAHVIIVQDIIDSGLTLAYLLDLLERRNPTSLRVCTFLVKDRPREQELPPIDFVGFHILMSL